MKKYVIAVAIVLTFSMAGTGLNTVSDPIMPSATAQWDDGTADNDDDGSTSDSEWDDGSDTSSDDSDSTSSDDTTSDDSWDSETADNDDDGSSGGDDTTSDDSWDDSTADSNDDSWDNETAENDDDGSNTTNDSWDNETAENDDSGWDNETAENDDSGSEDDSGEDDSGNDDSGDDGSEDDSEDEQTSSTGGGSDFSAELRPSQLTLSVQLSQDTVKIGEEVTVSGTLEGAESSRDVSVNFNGNEVATTQTDSSGEYSTSFTPDRTGTHTVTVESANQEAETELQVDPTVQITAITTASDLEAGSTVSVCPVIDSQTEAQVELFHNGESLGQQQGNGRICFDANIDSGENTFRAVATVSGDRDEYEITRNTSGLPMTQGEGSPAGNFFLSSTSARLFTAVLAGILITSLILYREGVRFRDIRP